MTRIQLFHDTEWLIIKITYFTISNNIMSHLSDLLVWKYTTASDTSQPTIYYCIKGVLGLIIYSTRQLFQAFKLLKGTIYHETSLLLEQPIIVKSSSSRITSEITLLTFRLIYTICESVEQHTKQPKWNWTPNQLKINTLFDLISLSKSIEENKDKRHRDIGHVYTVQVISITKWIN
jgi:hypothetical protein